MSIETAVQNEITKILLQNGINPCQKGFRYLQTAMGLVHKDYTYLDCIVKRLYVDIAEQHGTKGSRVERAIRHSIESMFDTTKPDVLDEYISSQINLTSGKITNSSFIAILDLILKRELKNAPVADGAKMEEEYHGC